MSQAENAATTLVAAGKTFRKKCRNKIGICDIYVATNLINGKKYVGMTSGGYKKRWREHVLDAKANRHRSLLHRAIRKYGEDTFVVEVVATANNWKDLCELEVQFIQELDTFVPNGYNSTRGGDGVVGHIPTEEEIRNRAEAMAKLASDPIWLTKLRDAIKQNSQNPVWLANVAVANRIKGDVRIASVDVSDPDRKERRVYQRLCGARSRARKSGSGIPKQNFVAAQAIIDANDAVDPEGAARRAYNRRFGKESRERKEGVFVPRLKDLAIAEQDALDPDGADRRRRKRESNKKSGNRPIAEKLTRKQKSIALDAADPAGAELRRKGRIRDKLRPSRHKLVPRKDAID